MRLTNQIYSFQKLELNYSVLPSVALSSVVFTIVCLEIMSRIKQLENLSLNPVQIKRIKIALFTTSLIASFIFFELIVKQQEKPFLSTTEKTVTLYPFPRLLNAGNNCFINALIQMIFSNHELASPFLHNKGLCDLYNEYQKGVTEGCKIDLGSSFRKLSKAFKGSRQHDPFDFFYTVFVQSLDPKTSLGFPFFKTSIRSYPKKESSPQESKTDSTQESKTDSTQESETDSTQEVDVKQDIGTVLNLCFPGSTDAVSMEKLIETTCHEYCNPKKEERYREKITQLISPSDYLAISLARFNNDAKSQTSSKLETPVSFNPIFSIPAQFNQEGTIVYYRWLCFLSHIGQSLKEGHYVSYHQTSDGSYYCCNDTNIRKVSQEEFIKQGAYLYGGIAERVLEINPLIEPSNVNETTKAISEADLKKVQQVDPQTTEPFSDENSNDSNIDTTDNTSFEILSLSEENSEENKVEKGIEATESLFNPLGVSLDIENYCTLSSFSE